MGVITAKGKGISGANTMAGKMEGSLLTNALSVTGWANLKSAAAPEPAASGAVELDVDIDSGLVNMPLSVTDMVTLPREKLYALEMKAETADTLRAQLAAVTTERDQWQTKYDIMTNEHAARLMENSTLVAERDALRVACQTALQWLNDFGEHAPAMFSNEAEIVSHLQAALTSDPEAGAES